MIERLIHYFKRFDYPVSSNSFALFRILYSFYTLGLIFQLYTHWPIYFDNITPYSISLFPAKLSLFLWLIASLFLLMGAFTKVAAIVNYLFTVLMTAFFANANISSFNDDLLRMGGFLLIILPVARTFSIDAFFNKLTYYHAPKKTSYLNYLLAILVTIGLLYFSSAFTKLFSPMWQKGIGLWIPAVIPSYKWTSFDFFVDEQWLMFALNYIVLAFELVFVFLLFHKKTHLILAIVGIGFHIGIAFLFPFTYISFGPILYYSLLIPDTWWTRISLVFDSKKKLHITYNPNITKQVHAVTFLQAFDIRKQYIFSPIGTVLTLHNYQNWNAFKIACKKSFLLYPFYLFLQSTTFKNVLCFISEEWLPNSIMIVPQPTVNYNLKRFSFFVGIATLCIIQILTITYHGYTTLKADKNKQTIYLKQRIATQDFSTKPSNLARTFFGINSRGVFLDHAFTGSKTIYSIAYLPEVGAEIWLPIFSKEGYCVGDNKNLGWHKLSFKYFGKTKTQPDTTGLKKYTAYWARKNIISLDEATFKIYRKVYPCPTEYEKGYLTKMLNLPWDTVGIIQWRDSIFNYKNLIPDTLNIK